MPSPPRPRSPAWRILIAGGGPPGLALGLGLAGALGRAVDVAICDPAFARPRQDPRAYALSPGIARMCAALGIWDALRPCAEPILRMRITDSRTDDAIRPDYLTFAADEDRPLGYMVEAQALTATLLSACREAGIILEPVGVSEISSSHGLVEVRCGDHRRTASLFVAADGSRSRLREMAGIGWVGTPYPQCAIVATIAHERPHEGVAIQHFLPSGPFAILPLPDAAGRHRSSIVWTERRARVPAILALSPDAVPGEIGMRFGTQFGGLALETGLLAHPLGAGMARSFVAHRIALLGDAAHEIHPLAGQGLNLGLADAASLCERIVEAVRLGLDPGSEDVLKAYERDRRPASVAMAATTDALNRLFSNDTLPVRFARDLGLGLVDRADIAKRFFAGEAAGDTSRAPRLLRGVPL